MDATCSNIITMTVSPWCPRPVRGGGWRPESGEVAVVAASGDTRHPQSPQSCPRHQAHPPS